jgi:hypothetical protein
VIRFALLVAVAFLLLGILRMARPSFERWRSRFSRRPQEAELIRDPVCGTWIDSRLAVSGRRGREVVPVCSESCRRRLESA